MNPLGDMIDQAIDRAGGDIGLRRASASFTLARGLSLILPARIGWSARQPRIVDPITGLA